MARGMKSPDPARMLAYMYQPILPALKKLNIKREGTRRHNPRDILVPEGYTLEVVATGLNAPVHCTFDDLGDCYVTESGYKVDSKPRIVKVDVWSGEAKPFFDLPEERWLKTNAMTGAIWHEGYLYFANAGTVSRIGPDGRLEDIVTGLPGLGDHQVNYPVVGPDGKLYFSVGTATNAGVVGADNFAFEWLPERPHVHDIPAKDVELAGHNYEFQNVLGDIKQKVSTGAFAPFGTPTNPGQIVPGDVKCTGAILRCNPDGTDLEVVAWGLRNPYGLAFHPDGRLFATEHGIDERGARYIVGDYDDLYQIVEGEWYGWPDFASGVRLDSSYWGSGGRDRQPVLRKHPNPNPPRPFTTFAPHAAANGLGFSTSLDFGSRGDAFVALFGDFTPITARLATPVGFKVVRVDMRSGQAYDFAVNRITGPASKLPHAGFERPSHCAFGPDGALYVVDFGEIKIAPEKGGPRIKKGTGTLWRIRSTSPIHGNEPKKPLTLPIRGIQIAVIALVGVAVVGGAAWWVVKGRNARARKKALLPPLSKTFTNKGVDLKPFRKTRSYDLMLDGFEGLALLAETGGAVARRMMDRRTWERVEEER